MNRETTTTAVATLLLAPAMVVAGGDAFQARLVGLDPALAGMGRLALAADDEIYVTVNNDELHRIDVTTGATTLLHAGLPLSAAGQMLIGDGRPSVGTDLVIADFNSVESAACCDGRVFRYDRGAGTFSVLVDTNPGPGTGDPFGLALGPGGAWGDAVYVCDFQGASPFAPFVFVAGGGVFAADAGLWTINRLPTQLEFGPSAYGGDLFVLDSSGSDGPPAVWRVSDTGVISALAAGSELAGGVAMKFGPGGVFGTELYVLTIVGENGAVRRVSPAGEIETIVTMSFPSGPTGGGMAFTEDGQTMLVTSNDRMYRITGGNTPGDLDGDGDVDAADLAGLLAAWGPCPPTAACAADLDGDGEAGPADLAILLANWG